VTKLDCTKQRSINGQRRISLYSLSRPENSGPGAIPMNYNHTSDKERTGPGKNPVTANSLNLTVLTFIQ